MAGGGEALGGGGKPKRGGGGKRKKKSRVGFRLDMTPLVDITFLLLTFFMLTTSMITPQKMEMNVPPEAPENVEVKESELFTIFIRDDGTLLAKVTGLDDAQVVDKKELQKLVVDQNIELKNRCIVSLKASGEAPYGLVVDVLDLLNTAETSIIDGLQRAGIDERKRKFTVAPLSEDDIEEISGL